MNVVDHAVTLDKTKTIEFALFPTPLKPFDPRRRQIRLAALGRFVNAFRAGVSRQTYDYYAIPFPDEFDAAYDGLPMGRDSNRYRQTPEMVFHGWWDNAGTVRAANPTTKVSYYARPGKVLVILANESKNEVAETVALKLPQRFAKAIDAVTGEAVILQDAVLKIRIPAELYRAVLLTP